jgi:glutamine synthetase
MIRIPGPGRIELRLPDGSANPYLLPAAVLHAGLDGVESGATPGKRLDVDMYANAVECDAPQPLPDNLLEALRALQVAPGLAASLGEPFVAAYLKLKLAEWRSYSSQTSAWELAHTFDC